MERADLETIKRICSVIIQMTIGDGLCRSADSITHLERARRKCSLFNEGITNGQPTRQNAVHEIHLGIQKDRPQRVPLQAEVGSQ